MLTTSPYEVISCREVHLGKEGPSTGCGDRSVFGSYWMRDVVLVTYSGTKPIVQPKPQLCRRGEQGIQIRRTLLGDPLKERDLWGEPSRPRVPRRRSGGSALSPYRRVEGRWPPHRAPPREAQVGRRDEAQHDAVWGPDAPHFWSEIFLITRKTDNR